MHTVGSLCTGYGGLDAGVRDVLGGDLVWVADPDPDASRILEHHHPDLPNLGSIIACFPNWVALVAAVDELAAIPTRLISRAERARRRRQLIKDAGDLTDHGPVCIWGHVEHPGLLCAGFPCQPWSDAGLGLGARDPRDLWPAVAHAIAVLRPRLVVLENVAGFARLRAGAGRTVGDLAGLGYDTRWTLLGADEGGAPHQRNRGFWLAWERAAADAAAERLARSRDGGWRQAG